MVFSAITRLQQTQISTILIFSINLYLSYSITINIIQQSTTIKQQKRQRQRQQKRQN